MEGILTDLNLTLGWTLNSTSKNKPNPPEPHICKLFPILSMRLIRRWNENTLRATSWEMFDPCKVSHGESSLVLLGLSEKNLGKIHKCHFSARFDIFKSWFLFDSLKREIEIYSLFRRNEKGMRRHGFLTPPSGFQLLHPFKVDTFRPLPVIPPTLFFHGIHHSL